MKLSELIEKYGDCEVKDELLEMIKPRRYWVPKLNERYFFITGVGSVSYNNYKNTDQDNFRIEKRNCYQSTKEAKFALDMYHFCKERSFEPDWEDGDEYKYLLKLNNPLKAVKVCCHTTYIEDFAPFYYRTEEEVQEVIDKYTFEELSKYYGRV